MILRAQFEKSKMLSEGHAQFVSVPRVANPTRNIRRHFYQGYDGTSDQTVD